MKSLLDTNRNFEEYIIDVYSRFFDLTEGREFALRTRVRKFNLERITVQAFMDEFAIPKISFMTILDILVSSEYTKHLTKFSEQIGETPMVKKDDSEVLLIKENKNK